MNSLFILNALVTPGVGLIFWTSIVFILLLVLLGKFAWKPILAAIKSREESIDEALKSAEKAKLEMQELKAGNEKILAEARAERDALLKEARDTKDAIINEAKTKAKSEADRILTSAREQITNEKNAAIQRQIDIKTEARNDERKAIRTAAEQRDKKAAAKTKLPLRLHPFVVIV